jgi:hypothetical protein
MKARGIIRIVGSSLEDADEEVCSGRRRCSCGCCVLRSCPALQAEAGKCKKYSASAIGVPADSAKGLAKVAPRYRDRFAGAKAKGKTSYKCSDPVLAECKATQFACK